MISPASPQRKRKRTLERKDRRPSCTATDKGAKFAWKVTAGTLIYSANRIPEISDTIVEIDNAMKWGYNWEMGPFETWDAIGVKKSVDRMKKEGLKIPKKIQKMLSQKS